MEPPEIHISRYEYSVRIRWAGNENCTGSNLFSTALDITDAANALAAQGHPVDPDDPAPHGTIPLAVTRRTAKKDALLAAGAAAVIVTDHDNIVEATHRHTNGAGADIILDSVMGPGLAELAEAAKRFSGTLVTVGWLDPRPAPFPAAPITLIRYMSFEHTLDPRRCTASRPS